MVCESRTTRYRRRSSAVGNTGRRATDPALSVAALRQYRHVDESERGPNQLGLVEATTSYSDCGQERIVRFQEWAIDGQPLRALIGATPPQEMTPLSQEDFWPKVAVEHLRQLLGEHPGEFADGRIAMLVCPIDADLGCSTISMRLAADEDTVTWGDFGRQVNYEPFDPDGVMPHLRFRFERSAYEALLQETLAGFVGA